MDLKFILQLLTLFRQVFYFSTLTINPTLILSCAMCFA